MDAAELKEIQVPIKARYLTFHLDTAAEADQVATLVQLTERSTAWRCKSFSLPRPWRSLERRRGRRVDAVQRAMIGRRERVGYGQVFRNADHEGAGSYDWPTAGAPRHDWLALTGGSIGYGLPAATGAAVACPNRPVWCLQADGSAMYTISALWTHAREDLDITTVIYNNSAYAILRMELMRVGAGTGGERARALFDLGGPTLDFVALAAGMGVLAMRARTTEEFADALLRAQAGPGPHLIEAVVPPLVP